MTTDTRVTLASAVHNLVVRLQTRSAADITDRLLPRLYPNTQKASAGEGCNAYFRSGVMNAVRGVIANMPDPNQGDFEQVHPGLLPYARTLRKKAYYVPELHEYVTISELLTTLELLDSARKHERKKGEETIAEAERLDALYFAAKRMAKAPEPEPA